MQNLDRSIGSRKMLVSGRQKDELSTIPKNIEITLNGDDSNTVRGRINTATSQNIPSLSRVHKEKVLVIRQQLAEGNYDPNERLNAALDILCAALTI